LKQIAAIGKALLRWRRMTDPSRKALISSAGLGLAIARDIIRAHGGTLTVTAAGKRGARFTVSLPAAT